MCDDGWMGEAGSGGNIERSVCQPKFRIKREKIMVSFFLFRFPFSRLCLSHFPSLRLARAWYEICELDEKFLPLCRRICFFDRSELSLFCPLSF